MSPKSFRTRLFGDFTLIRMVQSIVFVYGCVALFVFFRADSLIFLPQASSYQDIKDSLKIQVSPQENLTALYLRNPNAAYTLLYIHGNAEDLGEIRPKLEKLYRWGFSVLAYDYRGYGTSDGTPSETHAYQDADAAYTYLTEHLQIAPEQVIVYGRSLGGGSATYLARNRSVAGLILESTFTSAFRVAVPFPVFPFDKFPNLENLKQIDVPVLVMHGQADQVVPFHHGQRLYQAAPGPKEFLWLEQAGHNDFDAVAGRRLRTALTSFQKLVETDQT